MQPLDYPDHLLCEHLRCLFVLGQECFEMLERFEATGRINQLWSDIDQQVEANHAVYEFSRVAALANYVQFFEHAPVDFPQVQLCTSGENRRSGVLAARFFPIPQLGRHISDHCPERLEVLLAIDHPQSIAVPNAQVTQPSSERTLMAAAMGYRQEHLDVCQLSRCTGGQPVAMRAFSRL